MSFPFKVREVLGAQALETLKSLAVPGRVYPVLLGELEEADRLMDCQDFFEESPEELLQAALEIDVPAWLKKRMEGGEDFYSSEDLRGDWPAGSQSNDTFSGHMDVMTGKSYPEVLIALLPAKASWEVPCLLKFGGWNECPGPAEHAALFRWWYEKYGAQVVTMTHDTIEMSVEHPPTTREEALALAWEQLVYCPDIVTQGTRTVDALAATLLNGHVWVFWWD